MNSGASKKGRKVVAEIRWEVDTICMDYYMTLVDLKNPFQQMINWLEMYMNHKYPMIDEKKFTSRFIRNRAVLGSGEFMLGIDVLVNSVKNACERFQVQDFSQEFQVMVKTLFMEAHAFDDAVSVVEDLKKHYSVGLLSNADNDIIRPSIEENGFQFDFIITSEDAKANKPDKKIFDFALRKLNKESRQVIMVGDSQTEDVWGAERCNIPTAWINRNKERLKEGIMKPLLIVDDLTQVQYFLKKIRN